MHSTRDQYEQAIVEYWEALRLALEQRRSLTPASAPARIALAGAEAGSRYTGFISAASSALKTNGLTRFMTCTRSSWPLCSWSKPSNEPLALCTAAKIRSLATNVRLFPVRSAPNGWANTCPWPSISNLSNCKPGPKPTPNDTSLPTGVGVDGEGGEVEAGGGLGGEGGAGGEANTALENCELLFTGSVAVAVKEVPDSEDKVEVKPIEATPWALVVAVSEPR